MNGIPQRSPLAGRIASWWTVALLMFFVNPSQSFRALLVWMVIYLISGLFSEAFWNLSEPFGDSLRVFARPLSEPCTCFLRTICDPFVSLLRARRDPFVNASQSLRAPIMTNV